MPPSESDIPPELTPLGLNQKSYAHLETVRLYCTTHYGSEDIRHRYSQYDTRQLAEAAASQLHLLDQTATDIGLDRLPYTLAAQALLQLPPADRFVLLQASSAINTTSTSKPEEMALQQAVVQHPDLRDQIARLTGYTDSRLIQIAIHLPYEHGQILPDRLPTLLKDLLDHPDKVKEELNRLTTLPSRSSPAASSTGLEPEGEPSLPFDPTSADYAVLRSAIDERRRPHRDRKIHLTASQQDQINHQLNELNSAAHVLHLENIARQIALYYYGNLPFGTAPSQFGANLAEEADSFAEAYLNAFPLSEDTLIHPDPAHLDYPAALKLLPRLGGWVAYRMREIGDLYAQKDPGWQDPITDLEPIPPPPPPRFPGHEGYQPPPPAEPPPQPAEVPPPPDWQTVLDSHIQAIDAALADYKQSPSLPAAITVLRPFISLGQLTLAEAPPGKQQAAAGFYSAAVTEIASVLAPQLPLPFTETGPLPIAAWQDQIQHHLTQAITLEKDLSSGLPPDTIHQSAVTGMVHLALLGQLAWVNPPSQSPDLARSYQQFYLEAVRSYLGTLEHLA